MYTLAVAGALYIMSGLWCVVMQTETLEFLGFTLQTPMAQSEYLSVYGGLQVGLGLGMIIFAGIAAYREAGLLFAAIFSASLFGFRLASMILYPEAVGVLPLTILEGILAIVLWVGWLRARSQAIS